MEIFPHVNIDGLIYLLNQSGIALAEANAQIDQAVDVHVGENLHFG